MGLPSNVKFFTGVTPKDFEPDIMLQGAMGECSWVVIIGEDKNGNEFFSASKSSGPEILWAIERAKMKLLSIDDEDA